MYLQLKTAKLFFDLASSGLAAADDSVTEKPTLLMLHGGPGADQMSLRPHFDRFGDAYQVLYIDHRGCGRSNGAQETLNLEQWAQDVADLLAALGIEKPMVFGQSFGGMVAMRFAARFPDKVSKLILSSTAARFRLDATLAKFQELGGDKPADVARRFFNDPSVDGYKEYEKVCLPLYTGAASGRSFASRSIQRPEVTVHFFRNEMMEMDLRPDLAGVSCPTLILAGARDPVTPVKCSEEIEEAMGPNAQLYVFEGCGHGVHRDKPEESERLMRDFLAGSL
ncbi:MAG: alpha/beta hydrolase [Pseudomonadota bacterium]